MPALKKESQKKRKSAWIVYILSCGDGSLYTGITNDMAARLEKHLSGKGAKYTRGRAPLTLCYSENHRTKSKALKREIFIKSLPRPAKQALIAAAQPVSAGL